MTLKVGLIGCGNVVSYGHRPALTSLDEVELVALADVTESRRRIGQEWFGLPDEALYADYRELLKREDVEAVCITVPQGVRRQIVLDAIAAGKHILSEKPIATTPAIADEIIAAADRAGIVFGMVHNYVFFPEYRLMKQLIDAGNIGALRVATMQYLGVIDNPGALEYDSAWRHKLSAGGGVLMDMIHAVYLTEWLFGTNATQVMAFVDALEYPDSSEVEDTALLQIAFPNGYGAIHMGWGEGTGGVDLTGSDGQIRVRYENDYTSGFNRPAELYSMDANWERQDFVLDNLATHMDNIGRSFTMLWQDFYESIEDGREPVMPARTGKRALEIALAAYLSGLTGRVVTLPLDMDNPVYQKGVAGLAEVEAWDGSKTRAAHLFGVK